MAEDDGKPDDQPIEIEDDYELSLEAGVDDESLREGPSGAVFSITSYGADYPVDSLIKRLKTESIYVPKFQRHFVWSLRHASRFIESLLMGLPVPGIFLYKESPSNRHLVVDGQQRLRSLEYFYEGTFQEKRFRLVGVRKQWEGKTYKELEPEDQRKLDDSVVHATIFQQDEPRESQRSLYFVFERINSGGIRLSAQEIRNCINGGPFIDALQAANSDVDWRAIFGEKKNARLKDQELILRFWAMLDRRATYQRPMLEFLNSYTNELSADNAADLLRLRTAFATTIAHCRAGIGDRAFRPKGTLNAAVFEAVMLGVAERALKRPIESEAAIGEKYKELLANADFMRACERATADEESVKTRHRLAIDAFAHV